MTKFNSLTVKEVKKETEDCVSVAFNVPNELGADYQFVQGQYLTLKTNIDNEEVRRSYSLCSSPLDGELRVAIKKIEEGKFSTFANEVLKEGDVLDVMTPMGNFYTELKPSQQKNYVAFTAGSGITPILSILKTVLVKEPESHFTLFYGNKGVGSVIFKEEIEALKNKHMDSLTIHHIFSQEWLESPIFNGRIDKERCELICDKILNVNVIHEFFLCGPESMINAVRETLDERGVDKKHIHFELFTSPLGKLDGKKKKSKVTKEIKTEVTIVLDGNELNFPLYSTGEYILDEALKRGADLPYACKGGVCCTCKAKLEEGTVEMDVNYALEEDEVANGYILACQAHPTSGKVVVNFDV